MATPNKKLRAYRHNYCPFTPEYHPQKPHRTATDLSQTIHTLSTGAARRGSGCRAPPFVPTRRRSRCTQKLTDHAPRLGLGHDPLRLRGLRTSCSAFAARIATITAPSHPNTTHRNPTETPQIRHGLFTHYPQLRRDGEAAVERLPPSLQAVDHGALRN